MLARAAVAFLLTTRLSGLSRLHRPGVRCGRCRDDEQPTSPFQMSRLTRARSSSQLRPHALLRRDERRKLTTTPPATRGAYRSAVALLRGCARRSQARTRLPVHSRRKSAVRSRPVPVGEAPGRHMRDRARRPRIAMGISGLSLRHPAPDIPGKENPRLRARGSRRGAGCRRTTRRSALIDSPRHRARRPTCP
jgi:hypothetical protein